MDAVPAPPLSLPRSPAPTTSTAHFGNSCVTTNLMQQITSLTVQAPRRLRIIRINSVAMSVERSGKIARSSFSTTRALEFLVDKHGSRMYRRQVNVTGIFQQLQRPRIEQHTRIFSITSATA